MEETATTETRPWHKDALEKGIILGGIHIIVFLIVYFFFTNKITGFTYLFFIMLFNLGYCIYQGIQWRKEKGGYLEYGDAWLHAFMVLTVNGIVGVVFTVIFVLIFPSFPETMAQSQLDTSLYWAERFGAPEEAIEKMEEDFDYEQVTDGFTFTGHMLRFGIGLIFYAIAATITSFFVRKRVPEKF